MQYCSPSSILLKGTVLCVCVCVCVRGWGELQNAACPLIAIGGSHSSCTRVHSMARVLVLCMSFYIRDMIILLFLLQYFGRKNPVPVRLLIFILALLLLLIFLVSFYYFHNWKWSKYFLQSIQAGKGSGRLCVP